MNDLCVFGLCPEPAEDRSDFCHGHRGIVYDPRRGFLYRNQPVDSNSTFLQRNQPQTVVVVHHYIRDESPRRRKSATPKKKAAPALAPKRETKKPKAEKKEKKPAPASVKKVAKPKSAPAKLPPILKRAPEPESPAEARMKAKVRFHKTIQDYEVADQAVFPLTKRAQQQLSLGETIGKWNKAGIKLQTTPKWKTEEE